MEEMYLLNVEGVRKKILHGGQGDLPKFRNGTKLVFHFQTLACNFERTVIDDSRRQGKAPMEIIVGKMFKMEIWETLLTSMRIGEVAEFWCDTIHTGLYPVVSRGIRLIAEGKDPLEGQRHMCGLGNMFDYHCMGYKDLNELMKEPQPLIFIMELIQVDDPLSYKRDSWAMDTDEKLQAVPALHSEGNALVKQRRFQAAARKYQEAVILLRNVQAKEKPGEEEYLKLGRLITPLVLNYCQCMLELGEFYEVLEHTTELIHRHKGNVKAFYKRAKAHAAVWNEKEARQDFLMVASLDSSLGPLVQRELRLLKERMAEKYCEEKKTYWGILGDRAGDGEEQEKEISWEGEGRRDTNEAQDIPERRSQLVVTSKGWRAHQSTEQGQEQLQRTSESGASGHGGKGREEMLRLVPLLHNEGNYLMKEKRFQEASEKYKEAMDYVKFIQAKEDPQEEDWKSLEKVLLPLVLNYCQCKLELEEYYEVLEHTTELLKRHKGNVKAFYKRARAHAALCHDQQARGDFLMVCKLDPSFAPSVRRELKTLGEMMRARSTRARKSRWRGAEDKQRQQEGLLGDEHGAERDSWGPGLSSEACRAPATGRIKGDGNEEEVQNQCSELGIKESLGGANTEDHAVGGKEHSKVWGATQRVGLKDRRNNTEGFNEESVASTMVRATNESKGTDAEEANESSMTNAEADNKCSETDADEANESKGTDTEAANESKGADTEAANESKRTDTEAANESKGADTEAANESKRTDTEAANESKGADTEAANESKGTDTEAANESKGADTEATNESKGTDTEAANESSALGAPVEDASNQDTKATPQDRAGGSAGVNGTGASGKGNTASQFADRTNLSKDTATGPELEKKQASFRDTMTDWHEITTDSIELAIEEAN